MCARATHMRRYYNYCYYYTIARIRPEAVFGVSARHVRRMRHRTPKNIIIIIIVNSSSGHYIVLFAGSEAIFARKKCHAHTRPGTASGSVFVRELIGFLRLFFTTFRPPAVPAIPTAGRNPFETSDV